MALTITILRATHVGNVKEVLYDITFDSSYPAGGEPLTAADLKLEHRLDSVEPGVATKSDNSLAVLPRYDYTNSKLLAFKSNTAANPQPVADTADLSGYVCRVVAKGIGTAA